MVVIASIVVRNSDLPHTAHNTDSPATTAAPTQSPKGSILGSSI